MLCIAQFRLHDSGRRPGAYRSEDMFNLSGSCSCENGFALPRHKMQRCEEVR